MPVRQIKEKIKMAFMSLKDIDVSYDKKKQILKGLSLDVEKGELVSLLGPSGCGKSTTLRVVAGFIDPQGGSFLLDGEDMTKVPVHKRNFGLVFQSYALFPHLSVYDNVAFGLRTRKMDKEQIDKKVKDILEVCGLSDLANRFPRQMSGGQRQRVAMGRAIVRSPKVFLMDEPLSNLDAKLRVQMRVEISKLHQRLQTTIIYVTHDQTEAMTLGTRIVVLKDGIIQQVDTPQNLYNTPNNIFVAGFIGSPQMNLIDAEVKANGSQVDLVLSDTVTITLPVEKSKKLIDGNYVGKTVVVGIRPEDVKDDAEFIAKNADSKFTATVKVYELLGAEVNLHYEIGDVTCTAKVNPRTTARPGDEVTFAMDVERLHVFDKETEIVITH